MRSSSATALTRDLPSGWSKGRIQIGVKFRTQLPLRGRWRHRLELDALTDYERRLSILTQATEDATEGRQAFREKRAPRFTGR